MLKHSQETLFLVQHTVHRFSPKEFHFLRPIPSAQQFSASRFQKQETLSSPDYSPGSSPQNAVTLPLQVEEPLAPTLKESTAKQ
ncbi:hypothetical protein TNCV_128631 [Trichonephila clavipes]|nr:hypothetical protein TNCV_128631 [Trichonephila clavipes]